jgi:hypothetical protein
MLSWMESSIMAVMVELIDTGEMGEPLEVDGYVDFATVLRARWAWRAGSWWFL